MVDENGWIGVDLDGTFAHYDTWTAWNSFGKPIMPMVMRVKEWLARGQEVRIFTARVRAHGGRYIGNTWVHSDIRSETCRHTGVKFSAAMMASAIADYTEEHVGMRLQVTCIKDFHMIEFWDDRAIQVIVNTGRTLAEEHQSILEALRGAP